MDIDKNRVTLHMILRNIKSEHLFHFWSGHMTLNSLNTGYLINVNMTTENQLKK